MEGTAAVAVAAGDAVLRGMLEREIVLLGKTVAELRKVIILVDERDVQPRGTGVTVAAERLPLGFAPMTEDPMPRTLMRSPPCGRIRYSMV